MDNLTGLGGSLKIKLAACQFGTRISALHPLGTVWVHSSGVPGPRSIEIIR